MLRLDWLWDDTVLLLPCAYVRRIAQFKATSHLSVKSISIPVVVTANVLNFLNVALSGSDVSPVISKYSEVACSVIQALNRHTPAERRSARWAAGFHGLFAVIVVW